MGFNDRGKTGVRTSDVLIVWPWGEGRMSLYVHAALPTWLLLELFHVSFTYSSKILCFSCRYGIIRPYAFCFLDGGSSWYHRRLRTNCSVSPTEPVISRCGCHYRRNNVFLCCVATFLACTAPLWCSSLHGHLPTAHKTRRGVVWPRLTR